MERNLYFTEFKAGMSSLWKGRSPLMGELDMELTERCNNNCIHCYINMPADDLSVRKRELSTEAIKEILKEAASLGCLKVRFTGGEPLLREDFEELYIFARRLGLKVLIFTNATLITPNFAKLFARIPPLEKVEISLYGMTKQSYEAVTRSPGSFETAWQGINLLLERNVPFVAKCAFLPPNKGEMEELETWASDIPWMDKAPTYSMFFDLRCRRDSEVKNQFIKGLRVSPEKGLKVLTRRQEEYLKDMRAFCSTFTRPPGDKLFSCGAGCGGGCVDSYGQFQLCLLLKHPDVAYDLSKGSLKDGLENFSPKLREIKATNPEYLSRCARCFLKGLCEQCPAKSWMEHGTLDTPVEYLCKITHSQGRYLGLLGDSEMTWEIKNWRERIEIFSEKKPTSKEIGHTEARV